MRAILLVLVAACATATDNTANLPICSDLGCEYALCSSSASGSRCLCDHQACKFAPSCSSFGCDTDHPPTCDRLSCACDAGGEDEPCTKDTP